MKVVTSGIPYIDIDAYAGAIAYAELLNLQGYKAIAASSARFNESISKTVRSWNAPFETNYVANDADTYSVIDTSDAKHFDSFVVLDRVETVIDHHPNHHEYWAERLGEQGIIDFIGAAATLVYEQWVAAGLEDKMSVTSARLLVCAILDNTLNFKAKVTSNRDIAAYEALLEHADLSDDWPAQYFAECQTAIEGDVVNAIRDDMKILDFKGLEYEIAIGQLVVWDGKSLLDIQMEIIGQTMRKAKPEWFMSIVSISEGKNYFLSDNADIQRWVAATMGVTFDGNVAESDRLWLRKEIIKQDSLL